MKNLICIRLPLTRPHKISNIKVIVVEIGLKSKQAIHHVQNVPSVSQSGTCDSGLFSQGRVS